MRSLRLLSEQAVPAGVIPLVAVLTLLLFTLQESHAEAGDDLAIIVNKARTLSTLSSIDLRNIFLGKKDSWPDGTKLVAVSLPTERLETRVLLKEICGMSEGDFKRYFLIMNFQGKSVSPPRMLSTPSSIRAFVRSTPGALGVIRARDVDSSVAVLPIDGVNAGAPGYKLAIRQP